MQIANMAGLSLSHNETNLVLIEDALLGGADPPGELLLALRRQEEASTALRLLPLGLDHALVARVRGGGGETQRERRPVVGREGTADRHLPAGDEEGAQGPNLLLIQSAWSCGKSDLAPNGDEFFDMLFDGNLTCSVLKK